MQVLKLPGVNALARSLPEEEVYVIRSRRRQMVLEAFHVDPDADVAAGGPAPSTPAGTACEGTHGNAGLDF